MHDKLVKRSEITKKMNEIICLRKISGFKVRVTNQKTQNPTRFFITLLNPMCSEPMANVTKELISSSDLFLKFYSTMRKRVVSRTHFFILPFRRKESKIFRTGVHGDFSLEQKNVTSIYIAHYGLL